MEWPPAFYFWVVFFAFQLWVYGCFGCFYEEESALLELKSSINHPNGTSLPSWRVGTDCCIWEGVACSSTIGRVIALDLSSTIGYSGNEYWYMSEYNWYLNASLLLPFEELQSLDLSYNLLSGFLDEQELTRLRKLELLGLAGNNVMGTISPFIGSLTSLKFLSLQGNRYNGSQSIQGLCNLKNLQKLDLSSNELEGTIPSCLSNLTNLQMLDLSFNRFSGKIPASLIANLSSLLYFSLGSNNFSGLFALSLFAHLSDIKGFDLSNNNLEVETEYPKWNSTFQLKVLGLSNCKLNKHTGTIPSFLYGQHDLTQVDLSHNNLLGQFPIWLLGNNTRLKLLNLKNNSLGTFHLPVHGNNTDLIFLDVSHNCIMGQLPLNIGTLLPNLVLLNMSRNLFQGSIPPSVGDMRSLETLDLSHNNLSEEIPKSLVVGCVYLDILKLSNNNLHGKVLSTFSNLTYLTYLYLDSNHFTGTIPASLFNVSLQGGLRVLDIGDNQISGRIPTQVGDLPFMSTLILRRNHVDGMVPLEFCRLTELRFLDLSDNSLFGPIPSCFNLTNLEFMHLRKNAFSGSIPSALSKASYLTSLVIGCNDIVGVIPSWIGGLSKLRILLLRRNSLHGHIPIALCQLKNVSLLDLSYNHLSGQLPPCINNLTFGRSTLDSAFYTEETTYSMGLGLDISKQEQVVSNLGSNFGEVTDEITAVEFMNKNIWNSYGSGILKYMSGVDLSCNQFTGEIPPEMGQLSGLHSLNLSCNQFTGPIPVAFETLSQIESLDLSYNRLNGTIPSELMKLTFLSVFSVAHNNLSGKIPYVKQFATFSESSYDGNPLLCGSPLNRSCISATHTIQDPKGGEDDDDDDDDDNLVSFYAAFVGSYLVFLLGTIAFLYFTSQRRAVCFLHVIDSWCGFLWYKICMLFNCK
ncbi:hypothetical protein AAC387_Pa03g0459 [Persea americana]